MIKYWNKYFSTAFDSLIENWFVVFATGMIYVRSLGKLCEMKQGNSYLNNNLFSLILELVVAKRTKLQGNMT